MSEFSTLQTRILKSNVENDEDFTAEFQQSDFDLEFRNNLAHHP